MLKGFYEIANFAKFIGTLSKQINYLVYKLYTLTPDEIELIEPKISIV